GSVGVRSTPGSGSVFYAILPRRAETGATPKRRLPTTAEARSILIVEDEASDHALLVQSLIQAGYAVEAATTGAKALALCAERRFDALTLDLLLPDMSGQDVLARIR